MDDLQQAGERPQDDEKSVNDPLEAPRRPGSRSIADHESKVEPARVNEHPLQDVVVPAQVRPPHVAGLTEVSKRPLRSFPTLAS